jgi:predicted DNA-binding transcriptional regulator YafY
MVPSCVTIPAMPRRRDADRLSRLDDLAARLAGPEALTAAGLAAGLGVSRRTLFRGRPLLRDRGLPVEADPGRGGGLRLPRHRGAGRGQPISALKSCTAPLRVARPSA